MKLFAYCRGSDDAVSLIKEYAASHGAEPIEIISDGVRSYSGFRWLQNVIKRGYCDTLIIPSTDDLGEDKYIALENRLFLSRNGVRTVCIKRPERYAGLADARRSIVSHAARLFDNIVEWESDYGIAMPLKDSFDEFKRKPPFGYRVVSGMAEPDPKEAETVNYIFDEYIKGSSIQDIYKGANERIAEREKPFGNMTVKTVLCNERYIGRMSKKGYHLQPIVRYDKWLDARKRFERDYGSEPMLEPFCCDLIHSDRPFSCIRINGSAPAKHEGYVVNSDILESKLIEVIRTAASRSAAESVYKDFIIKEADEAKAALPLSAEAYNRAVLEFKQLLSVLTAGERDEELQRRLEELTDVKTFYGMRIRRINSEISLFSIPKEHLLGLFERASQLDTLSTEEKRFITEAFIRSVRIKDGGAYIYLNSPEGGRIQRIKANEVLM